MGHLISLHSHFWVLAVCPAPRRAQGVYTLTGPHDDATGEGFVSPLYGPGN